MKLIIAEKPSLARAIADAIGVCSKEQLCICCSDGYTVTWAAGHLLELIKPEEYGEEYRKWTLDSLPIIPKEWRKARKAGTAGLLENIKSLLSKAEMVVNAGDADREGQLLIDEILEYFSYKGPVKRLLVTDTTSEAIRRSLAGMEDNSLYRNLSLSAEARSRFDWLLGLNLTRLYTVKGDEAGHEGVMSVGRVQTPTLGLVVSRDREIENFSPKPYWEVEAVFSKKDGSYAGKWVPADTSGAGFDQEKRLISEAAADKLVESLRGLEEGKVINVNSRERREKPPLPHSLPTLQQECSTLYDLSPADTLKVLQGLYEAGLVTYPRSDCRCLPPSMHADALRVLCTIRRMVPELGQFADAADASVITDAWDQSKVSEHFAIVPTGKAGKLTEKELKVYRCLAMSYLRMFLGDYIYNFTEVITQVGDEKFRSVSSEPVSQGWKVTVKMEKAPVLPKLEQYETVAVTALDKIRKETEPPKRFTEASLLKAMNGIHQYVKDPRIRAQLKAVDGIGTAATQAGIIKVLFDRHFIEKEGKSIKSTKLGKQLIDAVGKEVSEPDLTALMEKGLGEIQTGKMTFEDCMAWVVALTVQQVEKGKGTMMEKSDRPVWKCPGCGGVLKRIKGRYGFFWGCQNEECHRNYNDVRGRPFTKTRKCTECGAQMRYVTKKDGSHWWVCETESCRERKVAWIKAGEPDTEEKTA